MDGDDYEHAEVGAEKAKQRAESVPKLADDDAATDGGRDFGRDVVFDQSGASGVSPTCIRRGAKDEDVAPSTRARRCDTRGAHREAWWRRA